MFKEKKQLQLMKSGKEMMLDEKQNRIGEKKDGCLTKSKKSFNNKILQNEQKVEQDCREKKMGV